MIRVGTEFEFIVRLNDSFFGNKIGYKRVSRLNFADLLEFMVEDYDLLISCSAHYQFELGHRFDDIRTYGAPKFTDMTPFIIRYDIYKRMKFYTQNSDGSFVKADPAIFGEIAPTAANDNKSEARLKAILSKLWVYCPKIRDADNTWKTKNPVSKIAQRDLMKFFAKELGIKFSSYGKRGTGEGYQHDRPKTHFGWYMSEEGMDSDGYSESVRYHMFELITPPMSVEEMKQTVRNVFKIFRKGSKRFTFVTAKYCGIHYNISKEGYSKDDYSPTFLAAMFDDEFWMKTFGRLDDENKSLRQEVQNTITILSKQRLICLEDIEKPEGFKYVVDMIDAKVPDNIYRSVNFDNVNQFCFLEHRSAGGVDYQYRLKEHLDYLDNLVTVTNQYQDRYNNPVFKYRLQQMLQQAGIHTDLSIRNRVGPAKYLHGERYSSTNRS